MKLVRQWNAQVRGLLVSRLRTRLLKFFGTTTVDKHGATVILPAHEFSTREFRMNRLQQETNKVPVEIVSDGGFDGVHDHGAFRWSTFNNAFVSGNGRVFDSRARLVLDSVASHRQKVTNPGWLRAATARRTKGTILNLNWWPGTGNFFHWNRDVLSRAFVLTCESRPPAVTLVVPEGLLEYQRHAVERLVSMFPDCQWTTQAFDEWRRADSVIVPSTYPYPIGSGFLHPEVADFVRVVNTHSVPRVSQEVRVLYVSRSKSKHRRVLDEDKLISALKKVSVVSVACLEDLSYQQQMALMQSVDILVGPYGAGLTNVLFTRRRGLLEIHNGDSQQTHYATLALSCRSPYVQVRGSNANAQQDFSLGPNGIETACESLQGFLTKH
jgi:capsular polysaccharide biosynthesis protein